MIHQRKGRKTIKYGKYKNYTSEIFFEKPAITNGKGENISTGINITIEIDAYRADKHQVKKDLAAIFAEVLEYFD